MSSFEKLLEYFSKFPGIGSRQAKRFVYHLLSRDHTYAKGLTDAIIGLKKEMAVCPDCFRNFEKTKSGKCRICENDSRDPSGLLVVASDIDLDTIESSGSYRGYYFVTGGLLPILDKQPEKKVRLAELKRITEKRLKSGIKEIILALNANPEGENTSDFLKEALTVFAQKNNIKISILGRGLSSGTEVEYSDSETIKNALRGRS